MKRKTPLLPRPLINRFEKSVAPLEEGEGKTVNPLLPMTLVS
jgi:hypothetical protein